MTPKPPQSQGNPRSDFRSILLPTAVLLLLIFSILFFKSFNPNMVVASNDGPYGAIKASSRAMPELMKGGWFDLNWLGAEDGVPWDLSSALRLVTSVRVFAAIYPAAAMIILGLCACIFFWRLKLTPLACILGGLAAALNSDFLSSACWGVASHPICFGMNYLALAALADSGPQRAWVKWAKTILAGFAVGLGIMEGFDIGAIFSVFVAAFVMFQAWVVGEGGAVKKISIGVVRTGVVAVFAGLIAAQIILALVRTQIQGVVGMSQDAESKRQRWEQATWISYPPTETLRIVIPGLFGYRMDTPKDMEMFGGAFEDGMYWGRAGETPGFMETRQGTARFNGGGEYAGILVVLVALTALAQTFAKKDSVFTPSQKKFIWFWSGAALVSLLLAFGRFAPFYQIPYALPYFSTIRNPAKFMHVFHWCLMVVFAYGIHGLSRRYMETAVAAVKNAPATFKAGLAHANKFDRRWVQILFALLAAGVLGLLIYAGSGTELKKLITKHAVPENLVAKIAAFSMREVALAVLFLAASVILLACVVGGVFSGKRARLGGILLGLVLVVDLSRANLPWILHWNYKEKYATNPVIDFLREKPYEHRVAQLRSQSMLQNVHSLEWAQHHFLYYDIQSLDVIQEPRMASDNAAFRQALGGVNDLARLWQLTNTRYLLGLGMVRTGQNSVGPYTDLVNQQLDPIQRRFRVVQYFDIGLKSEADGPRVNEFFQRGIFPGDKFTAVTLTNAPYAIVEFTGALPRAKLYSNWLVVTNDDAALKILPAPEFDPAQTVLVANQIAPASAATNENAGTVEFESYAPKRIVLKAKAAVTSVLLLNDKFDAGWTVTVDGQPENLLRCNYIMRGVLLKPGEHRVEFRFQPKLAGLGITSASFVLGLVLLVLIALPQKRAAQT